MSRATLLSIAFLVVALGAAGWLLTRPRAAPEGDLGAVTVGSTDPRSLLTFAAWSVHGDSLLLADIDPGSGQSSVPRRFMVVLVKSDGEAAPTLLDGDSFSWAPADRAKSARALSDLGFRVSVEGRAFNPPDDPLWSDPIAHVEGGTSQTVLLRAKGGATATFVRSRSDPGASSVWNRRAIAFLSGDGRLAYVTPDARVIRTSAR